MGCTLALLMIVPAVGQPVKAAVAQPLNASAATATAPPLRGYNITGKTSVSGISSGAFFAAQIGIAHSADVSSVGVFGGGSYSCGAHLWFSTCMLNNGVQDFANLFQWSINSGVQQGIIDPTSNIANQQWTLEAGSDDSLVGKHPMDILAQQLVNNGLPLANLQETLNPHQQHLLATGVPPPPGAVADAPCDSNTFPYIASGCGYDSVGTQFAQGHLGSNGPNTSPDFRHNLFTYDQTAFNTNNVAGLASRGYLYVPKDCQRGAACQLHVTFPGCDMSTQFEGAAYIQDSGYAQWADTNHMIVLFPQAQSDPSYHNDPPDGAAQNPAGCWDFIGWYGSSPGGSNYYAKTGAEMSDVWAMAQSVRSGFTAPPVNPNDAGLSDANADFNASDQAAANNAIRELPTLNSYASVFNPPDCMLYNNGQQSECDADTTAPANTWPPTGETN